MAAKRWAGSVKSLEPGRKAEIRGTVPAEAEYFQDHFPGFPVLPGVLMLDMMECAADVCLEAAGHQTENLSLTEVQSVKYSSFLKPGDSYEIEAELLKETPNEWKWRGAVRHETAVVAKAQFTIRSSSKVPAANCN